MLTAAVSGSFHHHMEAITAAVHELVALDVRVLSPADPRIVALQGDFLFVASDAVRSVRLVQDRHLESIRAADFLWLVCSDGYVGQSASMEVGFAAAVGTPIFSTHAPGDLTLRQYVTIVANLGDAVCRVKSVARPSRDPGILIDPHATVGEVHDVLERIDGAFRRPNKVFGSAEGVYGDLADVKAKLRLPTSVH